MKTEMVIRMEGGHGGKAMKVAAAMQGVESVTVSGKDKSLLRVVGDGVDCNDLTTRLRRKVGHADVVELRTLHAGGSIAGAGAYGYGGYGYGYGSRTGGSLSSDYGYGNGNSYPTTTAAAAAPDYYYGQQQQPSFQYSYQPPAPAPPAAVHYEYYSPSPGANDPNGCSIM